MGLKKDYRWPRLVAIIPPILLYSWLFLITIYSVLWHLSFNKRDLSSSVNLKYDFNGYFESKHESGNKRGIESLSKR